MPPEEPTALAEWRALVAALRGRMRIAHTLDAVVWTAWLGAATLPVCRLTGASTTTTYAALAAVAGGCIAIRWMTSSSVRETAFVAWLEAHCPEARNVFETTREILARRDRVQPHSAGQASLPASVKSASHPASPPGYVVARVVGDAVRHARSIDAARTLPLRRRLVMGAGGLLFGFALLGVGLAPAHELPGTPTVVQAASLLRIAEAVVRPPAYANRPAVRVADPTRLDVLAGSRIDLSITAEADSVEVMSGPHAARADGDRRSGFRYSAPAGETGFWTIVATSASGQTRRMLAVVVGPDQPPTVRITAPGKDLLYPDGQRRLSIAVAATDDVALTRLTIAHTKVSGSGERFEFVEGEATPAIDRRSPTEWTATAELALAGLHLEPGDVLVYRASARDGRPGAPPVFSDTFYVEIATSTEALEAPLGLPPDQERFALSQQMIILKTERLHGHRGTLSAAQFAEDALMISAEQRAVKTEFVFLMGEHAQVEDEEVEAEQSAEILAGRLENRGVKDLQNAVAAMSAAEQQLVAADTGRALPIERQALEALQRAFSRARYLLRSLPSRSRLDLSRRLAGNRLDAGDSSGVAAVPAIDPEVRAAAAALEDLRALMTARGRGEPIAGGAAALASRVLAIDPRSSRLQTVSQDLASLTDADAAAIDTILARAADALASLARRGRSSASPRPEVSADLRGAWMDERRRR